MFQSPIFKNQKRLSNKFLLIVLPPVVLSTALLMIAYSVLIYQDMSEKLQETVKNLIQVQGNALALHLWVFDTESLQRNLEVVSLYPGIARAEVRDTRNALKASAQSAPVPHQSELIRMQREMAYESKHGQHHPVGTISLWYHHQVIEKQLLNQLLRDCLMLLILVAVIVSSAFLANRLTIGTPLNRFLRAVQKADDPGGREPVHWPSQDELGRVIRAYNALLANLTEREERLRFQAMLLDQIRDVVVATDMEGRIRYVNEAATAIAGRPAGALLDQRVDVFGEDPRRGATQAEIVAATLKQGHWRGVVVNYTPEGQETIMETRTGLVRDCQGEPTGILGIGTDITEQLKAREALKESEARFRQMAETIDAIFFMRDLDDDGMIYVSPAYETIWGRSLSELYQNPASMFKGVHPEDRPGLEEVLKTQREQKERFGSKEYRVVRPDGEIRWVHDRAFPIRNAQGAIYRVAGVVTDITERKNAEETIRRSLREKEALLREVHHRVKNNLQIVSSLLNLQKEGIQDRRTRAALKDGIHRIRSLALIHERLYCEDTLERIDLSAYLKTLSEEIFTAYQPADGVELRTHMADSVCADLSTAVCCGLIANELLSNAVKYAFPDGRAGRVTVALSRSRNGELEFCIQDNGVGLPAEANPWESESLGLRLVSDLAVYQLKGNAHFSHTPGTRFRICFKEKTGCGPS